MNLKYLMRGAGGTKERPGVFFACHPADFDKALPLLSEDILDHAKCAVWYNEDPSEYPDQEELEAVLGEMQLVVFAVTSVFLHEKNPARNMVMPLALKNHIPILPIMLESGLGYEFSKTCASIQVVSRYVTDPTATPYEEVLRTYLQSVLVGDALAEKVRNAFDAYIFLSYRKKDRKHAQRLMRMIHENKEFQDFAIWYDEFLVPGEDFNDAIKDAFLKSSLFVMAVTPNLAEEGNYVMRVEYPMARDRKDKEKEQKKGFRVVSVEMYEKKENEKDWRIDTSALKDHEEFKYKEIENLQDEHRRAELDRNLLNALARIAKKENDGSAVHRFFIGLAYLTGIDVETDRKKALELLTGAAQCEEPCMEATAKLADMYRIGEGVAPDIKEAIRWQTILVGQYRDAYDRDHDPDSHKGYGTLHLKALMKLSDMLKEAGRTRDAVDASGKALEFCGLLAEEVGVREQERDRAVLLNRLGSLYRNLGDSKAAMDYFTQAVRIYERQAKEIGTQRVRRDLSISYERIGDMSRKQGDLSGAENNYKKAQDLRERLNSDNPSDTSRRDLSDIWTKMGNVRKSQKRYREAGEYYRQALEMDRALAEEARTAQARDDYGVSLVKTGDICKANEKWEEAAYNYEKARRIFLDNSGKTGSLFYLEHYAGACEKLASIRKKQGDRNAARELYDIAVEERRKLYEKEPDSTNANAFATSCYNAGCFKKDKQLLQTALGIWNVLCVRNLRLEKYRDQVREMLESIK